MKNICSGLLTTAIAMSIMSCGTNTISSIKGVVVDASLNTVTILTQTGDTLLFSTLHAKKVDADTINPGDSAELSYKGSRITRGYNLFRATKLVIKHPWKSSPIIGDWVQPIDGEVGRIQGFKINSDGTATSINMEKLIYESWKQNQDSITLTGKSFGNGQIDNFQIHGAFTMPDSNSLIIHFGADSVERYARLQ